LKFEAGLEVAAGRKKQRDPWKQNGGTGHIAGLASVLHGPQSCPTVRSIIIQPTKTKAVRVLNEQ